MACVLALDPGQTGDAAALVALRSTGHRPLTRWALWEVVTVIAVRGLTYGKLAALTAGLGRDLAEHGMGTPLTVVDHTGAGRPVTEMLMDAGPAGPVFAITFTGGEKVTRPPGPLPAVAHYAVPKWMLVEHIRSALEHQALTIPASTPGVELLTAELAAFSALGTTWRGRVRTGARAGAHDDTVTALASGLWAGDLYYAGGGPS
ncbi:hypothetical protein [Streptomyces hydrogenans]|uniref:hypothetical protein n=1 Tax=Streptomyces hydrogenans TaxID=1873719 RepID=UPI00382E5F52